MVRRFDPLPDPAARATPARKAAVVTAVRCGQITREAAKARYSVSEEEFRSWELRFDAHGQRGLSVTHLQDFRA